MIERKVTHHSAASATATGAVMNCTGLVGALVQVTGTFVATVTFQGTVDGSTWVAIQATNINSGAVATTATAAGLFYVPFAGVRLFRGNMAWTSGTSITVTGIGVDAATGLMSAVLTAGGVPVQLDDTDKLAVSNYGKSSAAGDVAFGVTADEHALIEPRSDIVVGADARTNSPTGFTGTGNAGLSIWSYGYIFNGSAWDRPRNNEDATLLASAARTTATDSADQVNYNGRGLIIIVSVTVDDASADLTPSLQIKDSISNAYYTVWTAAAAISAVGTFAYLFDSSPLSDAAELYTEAVNLRIARTWRLHVAVGDADSCTYSGSGVILV